MLERYLFPAALLLGCAPATLPVVAPSGNLGAGAHAGPSAVASAPAHRPRHVARLAPPFASAGGIRHVADGDVPAAVASTP